MVAKITAPNHITKAIWYNEHKVEKADALCIHAANFLDDYARLNIRDKVSRFTDLNALNKRTHSNTLHISLNFDSSEKLARDRLVEIASDYMDRIGFGGQPWLLYEHFDAAHPHVHIVTNNIRADGKRIDFHNIGRNESEAARKAIEIKYGLVKAGDRAAKQKETVKPLDVKKLVNGKSGIKQGITNVLDAVLEKYKYGSLPELNAILSLYNVRADPGTAGSRQNMNKGLVYHLLDEKGRAAGKRIKASAIYSRPTLAFLEGRFNVHAAKLPADVKRVKSSIDWVMQDPPRTLEGLADALKKEQVQTVIRKNEAGKVYGLTFVDVKNKSVLNGSDIDKAYSAKRMLEKMGLGQNLQPLPQAAKETRFPSTPVAGDDSGITLGRHGNSASMENVLDILMDPDEDRHELPWELRNDKKKKKNQSHNK